MSGQMKKYKESLAKTPEPIMLSQISQKMDLRGVMQYAREKGVKVAQLNLLKAYNIPITDEIDEEVSTPLQLLKSFKCWRITKSL